MRTIIASSGSTVIYVVNLIEDSSSLSTVPVFPGLLTTYWYAIVSGFSGYSIPLIGSNRFTGFATSLFIDV